MNKGAIAQQQFGKMAGSVLNSTAVLRLNFSAKLNICASISATSPSCKTLPAMPEKSRINNQLNNNETKICQ